VPLLAFIFNIIPLKWGYVKKIVLFLTPPLTLKVQSALAKDIIIAPFNILKRAITYPFHLYKTLSEDDNTTQIDPNHFVE